MVWNAELQARYGREVFLRLEDWEGDGRPQGCMQRRSDQPHKKIPVYGTGTPITFQLAEDDEGRPRAVKARPGALERERMTLEEYRKGKK